MFAIPRRALMLVLASLLVAACSSPPPAPVENRTSPPPAAKVPPRPPVKSAPAPASASRPSGVQAAPIPSSGVKSRPLSSVTEQAAPSDKLRSEPRGEKLAYSDDALTQMRRAAPAPASPAASATAPAPAAPAPAQPAAAPAPVASAGTGKTLAWPASGPLIKPFSEPSYTGISIGGKIGDPVNAAADGKVIFSGVGPRGYGNLVILRHDADTLSVYAHNSKLLVKDGEQVRLGQKIAEIGDSGTDRPKLHFEVRKAGKPVNPQALLPAR